MSQTTNTAMATVTPTTIDNKENTQPVVTSQPTSASSPPPTPKRKVSIANDPVSDNRYDNLAFEPNSKRKTSQVMLHVSLIVLRLNEA